jgi:hypothetical protein
MAKNSSSSEPDMRPEYDFAGGVRGKYAARCAEGANIVVIDPDLAEIFPDAKSVNAALRLLAELSRKQVRKTPRRVPPK